MDGDGCRVCGKMVVVAGYGDTGENGAGGVIETGGELTNNRNYSEGAS